MTPFVLSLYVLVHAANIILLKYLSREGFPLGETLMLRGLGCLICVGLWAAYRRKSLIPQGIRLQTVRLFVSGLSLLAIVSSYQFIFGTSVAVISRMDIAILIIVSFLVGEPHSQRQKLLAASSLGLFALFCLFANGVEDVRGYLLAFLGTVGVSGGFLLVKTSAQRENIGVIAGVAAFGLLVWGGVVLLFSESGTVGNLHLVGLGLLSGNMMFYIYALTVFLYRRTTVVRAEYPTLISVLLVFIFEVQVFHIPLNPQYLLFVLGSLVLMGWILNLESTETLPRPYKQPTTAARGGFRSYPLGESHGS